MKNRYSSLEPVRAQAFSQTCLASFQDASGFGRVSIFSCSFPPRAVVFPSSNVQGTNALLSGLVRFQQEGLSQYTFKSIYAAGDKTVLAFPTFPPAAFGCQLATDLTSVVAFCQIITTEVSKAGNQQILHTRHHILLVNARRCQLCFQDSPRTCQSLS